MTAYGFTLFDTAIGRCGVAWSERGLVGVQLPEASEPETRERMLHRFPAAAESAPPPAVQHALDGIVALLEASRAISRRSRSTWRASRRSIAASTRSRATIPPGKTLSYGEIAARLGAPRRGARRRTGARAQPLPDRRAVPSRAGGQAARSAAFRPMAARRRSAACWRSKPAHE